MALMKIAPAPARTTPVVEVNLVFRNPKKPNAINHGFVVDFSVTPKIGDHLDVEQNSIKQSLPDWDLHVPYWTVVDVRHDLCLTLNDDDKPRQNPLAALNVTVEPRKFTRKELATASSGDSTPKASQATRASRKAKKPK